MSLFSICAENPLTIESVNISAAVPRAMPATAITIIKVGFDVERGLKANLRAMYNSDFNTVWI